MRRWCQACLVLMLVLAGLVAMPIAGTAAPSPAPKAPIPASDWTHVNSCNAGSSYYYDSQYRTGMRVGRQWDTSCKWRTLMKFDLSQLAGAQILGAEFRVTADHTGACAGADVELWRSEENLYYPSVTWNNSSAYWYNAIETEHFDAHEGGACPKSDYTGIFDEGGQYLEEEIKRYLSNGWTTMALGLRAQYEGDHFDWSKFLPSSPVLMVTYNHAPTPPTGLEIISHCGDSCAASGAQVRSGTPTLQAVPGDPNGGTLDRQEFEVYDRARTVQRAASGTTVSETDVGHPRSWEVTPALGAGEYSWRVRGCDTVVCGEYSSWFDFTVDLDPPTSLAVSSTAYPPGTWNGGIGVPGSFTVSASGASKFELTVNGVNRGWVGGSSWTGDLTPDRDGVNVLTVRAADLAGNVTAPADYQFLVRPAPSKSWVWGLNEGSGPSAQSDPSGRALSVTGTSAWTTHGLSFDGSAHWTGAPVVDTTKSFSVTAWVDRSASATGTVTAVSQDGADGSGFRLQYRTDLDIDPEVAGNDPAWCFAMFAADGGAETTACSTEQTGPGRVHLAGVYDQVNRTIRIYVNGSNFDGADVKAFTGSWSAGKDWVLGGARVAGGRTQLWTGAVDRVAAYLKVLNHSDIASDKSQA